MFCKSSEVTLCGWRGCKPSINKQTNCPSLRVQFPDQMLLRFRVHLQCVCSFLRVELPDEAASVQGKRAMRLSLSLGRVSSSTFVPLFVCDLIKCPSMYLFGLSLQLLQHASGLV